MQCSDWTKKNSSTTTLPFRVESGVVLPEGSEGLEMRNSGDLRGAGDDGSAGVETVIRNRKTRDVCFRICIVWPVFDKPLSPWPGSAHLLPFVDNALHFRRGRGSAVFRVLFALEDPGHHPGNHGSVEDLHIRGTRNSRHAEIQRPVQRILEGHVFGGRTSLGIFLQTND